jgi:two-component system, cell cycle sensor histidine kinase and response regulator CckA
MALLLVVDDDPDVLDALCGALAPAGHVVERAASGLLALEILDQEKPIDLVLTDVPMPGLHGVNLARMAVLRRRELKVLYMSGYTDLETILRDEGPRLGKLLSKPILPADLQREVAEALAAEPSEQ